jgi:adenine-specific DNA-methyltransferase
VRVEPLGGSFAYARLGDPLFGDYRDMGDNLPPWEDIARYIFYTETSREIDPKRLDKETGFIGAVEASGGVSYYLFYIPNHKDDAALKLGMLKEIVARDKSREIVAYCEKVWIHEEDLRKFQRETGRRVRPMLVPFDLK